MADVRREPESSGSSSGLTAWLGSVLTRLKLQGCSTIGRGVRVRGKVHVHGGGSIHIGDDVVLDGLAAPIELYARPGAEIVLGRGVQVGCGVSIESMARVEIGEGSVLSGFCKVLDSHLHPMDGNRHKGKAESVPVRIGKGCHLGWRSIVLPGGELKDGARILPAVTVTRVIPAGVTIGGSPPKRVVEGQA